ETPALRASCMRLFLLLSIVCSELLFVAGAHVIWSAPELVRTADFRQYAESHHWPGDYATTMTGCFFRPDMEAWESRIRSRGWCLLFVGAGIAAVSLRLFLQSKQSNRTVA